MSDDESARRTPVPEKRYCTPTSPTPPEKPAPRQESAFGNGCVSPILLLIASAFLGSLLSNLFGDSLYGAILATCQGLLLIVGLLSFAWGKKTNDSWFLSYGKGVLVAYGLVVLLFLLLYGTCALGFF